eukprot:748481-Hanusia_phi.AAC.1
MGARARPDGAQEIGVSDQSRQTRIQLKKMMYEECRQHYHPTIPSWPEEVSSRRRLLLSPHDAGRPGGRHGRRRARAGDERESAGAGPELMLMPDAGGGRLDEGDGRAQAPVGQHKEGLSSELRACAGSGRGGGGRETCVSAGGCLVHEDEV